MYRVGPGERLDRFRSVCPLGQIGEWRIRRVKISPEHAAELSRKRPTRPVLPGIYNRLERAGESVQTDYPTQMRDHYRLFTSLINQYEERPEPMQVLVYGLGLGIVIRELLRWDPAVIESVTVVEKHWEVIKLVRPHLRGQFGDSLRVVQGEAKYKIVPRLDGRAWNAVWLDVWDEVPGTIDVPVMREYLRRIRGKLLARPNFSGAPRQYELRRKARKLRDRWKDTSIYGR